MISIDTNYIVRFLTHDIESQFIEVQKIFLNKENEIYFSTIAIAETIFILENHYKTNKVEAVSVVDKLLITKNIKTEPFIYKSLLIYKNESISFYDSLIAAEAIYKKLDLKTFDKKLVKVFEKYSKG